MLRSLSLGAAALGTAAALAQQPADAPSELDGPLIDNPVLTEDVGGLPGSPLLDATEVLAEATEVGGLLYLNPTVATDIIDGYAKTLAQYAGTEELIEDLNVVSEQLKSGTPDGAVVGAALVRLGERTAAAAEADGGPGNYAVLGGALTAAGEQLTGE